MGDLQWLPVLIRHKASLNQEAVDQSEHHTEHSHFGPQLTCAGPKYTLLEWPLQKTLDLSDKCRHHTLFILWSCSLIFKSPTADQRTLIFFGVKEGFSFPQFHIFHFTPKLQTWSDVLHQDILSLGLSPQPAASIVQPVNQVSSVWFQSKSEEWNRTKCGLNIRDCSTISGYTIESLARY